MKGGHLLSVQRVSERLRCGIMTVLRRSILLPMSLNRLLRTLR